MRPTLAILSLLSAASLVGCSAPKTQGTFDVPAGSYAQAFDATRDVLRSYRFTLERTDAQQGVITTAPKTTQGLASPWDAEQSSVGQEWEDFVNQQRRRVRVTFEPAGEPVGEPAGEPAGDSTANPQAVNSGAVNSGGASDLKPLVGKVEVIVERVQRPGWRPATRSIRSSAFAYDEDFGTRGLWPTYTVVQSGDPDLADRLAEQIRRRLAPR